MNQKWPYNVPVEERCEYGLNAISQCDFESKNGPIRNANRSHTINVCQRKSQGNEEETIAGVVIRHREAFVANLGRNVI